MNLSKKKNEAAPTSYLESRFLELKGEVIQWKTDAALAQRDATTWKKRHAQLSTASGLVALGAFMSGILCGMGVLLWLK